MLHASPQSVDSRETAAIALATLHRSLDKIPLTPEQQARYDFCVVRLLQDDDSETRDQGYVAAGLSLVEGKAVEATLRRGGDAVVRLVLADEDVQFGQSRFHIHEIVRSTHPPTHFSVAEDLDILSNPSSLLFAIEKPNIYRDDHLVPSILFSAYGSPRDSATLSQSVARRLPALAKVVETGRGLEAGPLGREGNEVVCKWATPLIWACARDASVEGDVAPLRSCA